MENVDQENKVLVTSSKEQTGLILKNNDTQEHKYIELIYEYTGYKCWTKISIILCTFFIMSVEGLHLYLTSALIDPFRKYYYINTGGIEFFASIMFVGIGLGSFSLSILCNYISRIRLVIVSMALLTFFQLVWTVTENFILISIIRCIIGIFLGIIVPLSNSILCEYLPIRLRAFWLTIVWIGFGFGQIVVITSIAIVMPQFYFKKVEQYLMSLIPYFLVVLMILNIWLEDSPRNHFKNGRPKHAFKLLQKMLKRELTHEEKEVLVKENSKSEESHSYVALYKSEYFWRSMTINLIGFFTSSLVYGPMLIANLEITTKTIDHEEHSSLLKMFTIVAISMIANPVGAVLCELPLLGRRVTCAIACGIGVITSIITIINPENRVFYNAPLGFGAFLQLAVFSSYILELFPTKYRDLTVSLFYTSMRVGGFTSQFIFVAMYYTSNIMPYYFYGLYFGLILVLLYALPYDTCGRALEH